MSNKKNKKRQQWQRNEKKKESKNMVMCRTGKGSEVKIAQIINF